MLINGYSDELQKYKVVFDENALKNKMGDFIKLVKHGHVLKKSLKLSWKASTKKSESV